MRVLIVDDEKPARDRLKRMLQEEIDICVMEEAKDGLEALELIEKLKPDFLFMDIEMPKLNGIEAALSLGSQAPPIIFITAYNEYALKAFETYAIDYIVKPIQKKRLAHAINKFKNLSQKNEFQRLEMMINDMIEKNSVSKISIKSGSKYIVIDTREISAILASDHYSEIFHGKHKNLSEESLDFLKSKLDSNRFIRVHRSAIINFDYLKELKREGDRKYLAVLSDEYETTVRISREKLPFVKKRLGVKS